MAEKTNFRNHNEDFWANLDMDSSDEDAFIPGVSAQGNRRPSRVKGRKTREVKAKIPVKQPVIEDIHGSFEKYDKPCTEAIQGQSIDSASNKRPSYLSKPGSRSNTRPSNNTEKKKKMVTMETKKSVAMNKNTVTMGNRSSIYDEDLSSGFESFAERSIRQLKQASLKDLRPEDKQRVANLIKELARVGEEREKAVKDLHGERQHYEQQLVTLVDQQENILKEREDVQDKLFQCQQLLTEYQSQLLNKQDRLNSSIADMKEAIDDNKCQSGAFKTVNVMEVCPPGLCTPERRSLSPNLHTSHTLEIVKDDRIHQSERPSRPRSRNPAPKHKPTNQNHQDIILTNENEHDTDSVDDLLLENKDPLSRVKRPFTSLIDKEIARERSRSRGSVNSRSRSRSPGEGRPRFSYPQKQSGFGPLHDPVASSTHKSMEIRAHMAQLSNIPNVDLDSPRSSIRGSSVRAQSPANSDRHRSKVAFYEEAEANDYDVKMHSPNVKHSEMFKDPEYGNYYKKLTPTGRKRELLKQRQALLDEQERLRKVLEKQERQLVDRKAEIQQREELQKQRMDFYKEGGKFPALKLDFDTESEKGMVLNIEKTGFNSRKEGLNDREAGLNGYANEEEDDRVANQHFVIETDAYNPEENIEIDDDVQIRSRVSAGTSPLASPRVTRVTMATSPVQSQESLESDIPRLVDVATSISYRSPLKDTSNRQQGNLPLATNRQRHSPGVNKGTSQNVIKQRTIPTTRLDIHHSTGRETPGEKTLNVLEIVNSMEETPHSYGDENRHYTPNKHLTQAKDISESVILTQIVSTSYLDNMKDFHETKRTILVHTDSIPVHHKLQEPVMASC